MTTKAYGFTILELLVVLFLFSLLAGVAIPRLTTMYKSFQIALERDEVLAQLGSLNYFAFQQSRDFELTIYPLPKNIDEEFEKEIIAQSEEETIDKLKEETTSPLSLKLPEGWQVRAETPILFRANGVCSGGFVYLNYQDQEFRVQLEAPFCQAKLL